ncbi:hypothetical protein Acsp03_63250 [Actinomadura sp. NBRC 104412]|uniref:ATP-dependent nuclease n=1 Tax=Actinomadura sp. NBRC 104412 TaxID=3032203 RepID=UPI0024A5E0EA|nr:AAA family ATPase [Actinomadura sp. NBRC 104412]GLZ08859.1 hypothetical protein Acsp03_63250 [Actinomadura sp. NBRC 104412]
MRPRRVAVRNVRGALDVEMHLRPMSALIGPNNAGKTTLLDAVRLFYGALDWDPERDRPWDEETDGESWVEIDYEVSPDEADDVFGGPVEGGVGRIRRYLTDGAGGKAGAYYRIPRDGDAGEPEHTGWTTAAKLGQCVYIPTISPMGEQTSASGPTPLRDVMLLAFSEQLIDGLLMGLRGSLAALETALAKGPITELESDLDDALKAWGLSVRVNVGDLSDELIMRHLITLNVQQGGTRRPLESQGSGVQRALIAALIQAAAKLRAKAERNAFRWILFEEPEAFLHPAQVTRLAHDLRKLVESGNSAVTITTHDPTMLAAAETPPEAIVRVQRPVHRIDAVSPAPERVDAALNAIHLRSTYARASMDCFTKARITNADEERHRVLYDLDARRAAAFFADQVIVVEGPSDVLFFDWLARQGHLAGLGPNVGVLDAFGKYELHRASSTLSLFGIPHVVLWNEDAAMATNAQSFKVKSCRDRAALQVLAAAAHDAGSALVGAIRLTGTIERWLDITEEKEGPWKSANIGAALTVAYADPGSPLPGRVDALLALLTDLFDGRDVAPHRATEEFAGALIEQRPALPTLNLSQEVADLPRSACTCPSPQWPPQPT